MRLSSAPCVDSRTPAAHERPGCATIPISAGNTERQIVSEDGALFWSQIDDVMKTFPEMSSWYQIEVDTDHRSLDIVTLKAEPNPDVDLDSIADIDRLQKRISVARRLDARGRWLQGAHAGRPLDRPRARAEQSASLDE